MPNWMTVPEFIKIIVLLFALSSWGFSVDNRIAMTEQAMEQDTLSYRYMQDQMVKRLDTLATRIDERLARIEGLLMERQR